MTTQAQMEELFASVEGTSVRRMFGGLGIFRRGIMFGLVVDDVLHLKTDESTRGTFAAEDSRPWVYQGRHRAATQTSYWRLPERLYDEPDEFREWALAAFAAAERTAKPKKGAASSPPAAKKRAAGAAVKKQAPLKRVMTKKVAVRESAGGAKEAAARKRPSATAKRQGSAKKKKA